MARCFAEDPTARPTMQQIADALEPAVAAALGSSPTASPPLPVPIQPTDRSLSVASVVAVSGSTQGTDRHPSLTSSGARARTPKTVVMQPLTGLSNASDKCDEGAASDRRTMTEPLLHHGDV